ncbi:MAG: hypothetical protein K6F64_05810 [Clostridia bacterium]|nr:hypothetical protein [Clostridia bacterium]
MCLSEYSKASVFFDSILNDLKESRIIKVFTIGPPCWDNHQGYRSYLLTDTVYICFDNGKCLVFDYYYIDSLSVEYKIIDSLDEKIRNSVSLEDYFNTQNIIFSLVEGIRKPIRIETISLEYDYVTEIIITKVNEEYLKWTDDGKLEYFNPNDETFSEITLIMANGKSVHICPCEADDDGYQRVWATGAKENIKPYPNNI